MRTAAEKILLIGDTDRTLQAALMQSRPAAQVVCVATVFDGIAELHGRPYSVVMTAAEPIERRPESAVRTLRELTGNGRLLLFGHPTLEPLSKKMLEFGVDDYLVTPTTAADLSTVLTGAGMRLVDSASMSSEPLPPVTTGGGLTQLQAIPMAELLLDAMLQSPHESIAAAVRRINSHLEDGLRVVFTPVAKPSPTAEIDAVVITVPVRSGADDAGSIHLLMPVDEDQAAARHLMATIAGLLGRVAGLQDRHARLQRLAITDELTGLYNGRYFRHYLRGIIEKARTMRFPVTLLLFDIDNFKRYNDQYGHGVGDEILRQTATLMTKCVRDHDFVARISGDEFAVVFWEKDGPRQPRDSQGRQPGTPGRPPQTPVQMLERFRRLLATQTFTGLGPAGQGSLTISGGLAVYPYDAQNVDDLISAADRALMFKAKKSGKNSIYLVGGQPSHGADVVPPE